MPTLAELAQAIGGRIEGDPGFFVQQLKVPALAGPADLCVCLEKKHEKSVHASRAGALVCTPDFQDSRPRVIVSQPRSALAKLNALFSTRRSIFYQGIHPSAVVDPTSQLAPGVGVGPLAVIGACCHIGAGTQIDAGVVIGPDVSVGEKCLIYAHVVIYEGVHIGHRVILHSGAVIGSDGFGYVPDRDHHWHKVPQIGSVILHDDVEIGANTTVDRGSIGDTVIGRGTKIDNLCQVAHNVIIGEDCAFAATVAIAGSVKIGNRVSIGGQAAILGHIEVGDDVLIHAQAGVTTPLPTGARVSGFPARDHREQLKREARLRKFARGMDKNDK